MANLRANNLTGTGGRNAIDGSVFFEGESSYLTMASGEIISGTGFGTNDFTVEFWINQGVNASNYTGIFNLKSSTTNDRFQVAFQSSTIQVYTDTATWRDTGYAPVSGAYEHIAFVRNYSGNTLKMYVNGEEKWSVSNNHDYDEAFETFIGLHSTSYGYLEGYISNLRVLNGTALYTTNYFTPPTTELTLIPNTVLLCCQDSNDPTQEATGKTITGSGNLATAGYLETQPKVIPPVGVDEGVTFEGDTKINSQCYMYFPTGRTEERSRGRGVLGGGAPFVSPNVINNMQYIEVQSGGIFKDFGDLTVARGYFPAGQTASSTRGLSAGGWTGSGNNTIDYITIATTSNATEFGDTSVVRPSGGLSNQTRSVNGGDAALTNTIDYVTIATTGNAADFGDLVEGRGLLAGVASPTRGVFGGGRNNTPSSNTLKNTMEYITIATTGNTTDFGDLQALRYGHTAFSSSVRGIWAGGYLTPGQTATIDYFTIATLGNSADFGDLSINNGYCGSVTNSIRGAVTINDAPNYYNTIEYITIATLGNAKDFGNSDPTGSGKGHGDFPSCMSDSHGGVA